MPNKPINLPKLLHGHSRSITSFNIWLTQ